MVRIVSTVLLLVVGGLVGLWVLFVRAPSPQAVCDHIVQVTVDEATQSGMSRDSQVVVIEQMRKRCVKHKLDKIQLRGRISYARYARCVVGEQSVSGFSRC